MKKFKGHKTLEQIRMQCLEQGVQYVFDGAAVIGEYVDHKSNGWARFDADCGRFWGRTPRGVEFDSVRSEHSDRAWFQALQAFFWIEDTEAEPPPLPAHLVWNEHTGAFPPYATGGIAERSAADIVTANRPAAPQRRPSTRLTRMAAGVLAANGGAA